MTCDEVVSSLPDGAGDEAVQAHLAGCVACSEAAAVLGLAVMPPLTASEKAKLVSLPIATHDQWSRLQRRRSAARKFVGLAIAASLGAVVASGLMWRVAAVAPVAPVATVAPEVLLVMDDAPTPVSDEDVSFEVSWPSLNDEGDVL